MVGLGAAMAVGVKADWSGDQRKQVGRRWGMRKKTTVRGVIAIAMSGRVAAFAWLWTRI